MGGGAHHAGGKRCAPPGLMMSEHYLLGQAFPGHILNEGSALDQSDLEAVGLGPVDV